MSLILLVFKLTILPLFGQIMNLASRFPNKSDLHASLLDLFLTSCPSHYRVSQTAHVAFRITLQYVLRLLLCRLSDRNRLFSQTPFCYQRSDGDSFHDFLRDATWIDILNLNVDNGAPEVLLGQKAATKSFYLLGNNNPWYIYFDSCYISQESLFPGSTSVIIPILTVATFCLLIIIVNLSSKRLRLCLLTE